METNRYEAGNKYGNRSMLLSHIKYSIDKLTIFLEGKYSPNKDSKVGDIIIGAISALGFRSATSCSNGIYNYTRSVVKSINQKLYTCDQSLTMVFNYKMSRDLKLVEHVYVAITLIEIGKTYGEVSHVYAYSEITIMDMLKDAYESIQDQILVECLQEMF